MNVHDYFTKNYSFLFDIETVFNEMTAKRFAFWTDLKGVATIDSKW